MSANVRKNILNGQTAIIKNNYSCYTFSTQRISCNLYSGSLCQGCKRVHWCCETLFKEKLCFQCFTKECCTFCRRWCGSSICEDCEDDDEYEE
jgi:hypothetical protein